MGKRMRNCNCCPRKSTRYKPLSGKDLKCKQVNEIIEALTIENLIPEIQRRGKATKPRYFKMKPFKPPIFKDTCVPMVPSIHTRMKYIGHCPLEPPSALEKESRTYEKFGFVSSDEDGDDTKGKKKKVRYYDLMPSDILLPKPCPVIKHTDSNTSILNVPSPKTSGEVIAAQRASVKPGEHRTPMPPKAAYELFKPHSGIIINADGSYFPDMNVVNVSDMETVRRKKSHKCNLKTCPNKKCRKYQKKMKQLAAITKRRQGHSLDRSKMNAANDEEECNLDEIPDPEPILLPMNLKRGALESHSLTVIPCTKEKTAATTHFGILSGCFNMFDAKFGARSRGRQALVMSVMSYCLAFHYHPQQWTIKLIDIMMDASDQWYLQLLEKVHDHSSVQGICEVIPFGKKQKLLLNGKRMLVLLGEPEIVGYTMSLDPTVYNLIRGLKAFFNDNRAGIMMSRILKVAIWKDKVCYYMFDPAGRDAKAYSNFATGNASLMNFIDLNAIAEALLNRSILQDQKFVLAPVKVLRMVDEAADEDLDSDRELTQAEKAMFGYRILNENYGIVNANMHLGDRCFEDARFRQAIPIAIVAMTYAKISPPNTWYSKTLDKILRLGNNLYVKCKDPTSVADLTIDNIPNEIAMGPYACEIIIYRERVKGQLFSPKDCFLNIKTGLKEFFNQGYNSGLIEFNNYALAVWKQKDMYYLFDPYPRTTDGLRTVSGKACCMMCLNPETCAITVIQNFDYLPPTSIFAIHAFKVLKLKKQPKFQAKLTCTLSEDDLGDSKKGGHSTRPKRSASMGATGLGDGITMVHDVLPADSHSMLRSSKSKEKKLDEEHMGDIVSLVDSIQEDFLPPISLRHKQNQALNLTDTTGEAKLVNLDSPTVSVTQIVPPWPKPRDKTNEPPEPDPDPEPTPPPTPPPPVIPEGGIEEEEKVEEEEDEQAKKERKERKRLEEEEARRKAEELPPPLPPPPPSPQPEPEVPLATALASLAVDEEEIAEMQAPPPDNVDRKILLTRDAQYRFKLRQMRKKMTAPLSEMQHYDDPQAKELTKLTNFKDLPDKTQILRAAGPVSPANDQNSIDVLPFGAIMAVVTSYKYAIETWSTSIVDFVVNTAKKLYANKQEKFRYAPVHIIPKIAIGHQAYHASIDVIGEGATWELEPILQNKFFRKYDRGMLTTATYSCAIFKKGGLYYLFDGTPCNGMGLRVTEKKGQACFLRFRSLRDLVCRITYNKDGKSEDQQFILSKIMVRRLLTEPRRKLPEDWDYNTQQPKNPKSKTTLETTKKKDEKKKSSVDDTAKVGPPVGYQKIDGLHRIEGTTALTERKPSSDIKPCHFVSLIAMLMATMYPIRTWHQIMVDNCVEKGLEINEKATNKSICEKRIIRNIILDGKFINVNVKKIFVVNENEQKRLDQYLKAVMKRLRYVIIYYPHCSMVICQADGYYHLFDPYPSPIEEPKDKKEKRRSKKDAAVASWTLYPTIDSLCKRLRQVIPGKSVEEPEFYTFELTSVKLAPRHSAFNYRLSPLFKPDVNPNAPYLKRSVRVRPPVNERMYWLNIELIPWSRMTDCNDCGLPRKIPKSMWMDWDIEFPGDLYSLWGSIHPKDERFSENSRGNQYLATCAVALGMTQACALSAWTGSFLDGIVIEGDKYHQKYLGKVRDKINYEASLETLDTKFSDYPFSFDFKFEQFIFGFVYSIHDDKFNLSKALAYFFESNTLGILVSQVKNLAFGKSGKSYFMYDCQSYGAPLYVPGQRGTHILKCESLNRLVYCMTVTLNIRRHGQQFNLYKVNVTVSETAAPKK